VNDEELKEQLKAYFAANPAKAPEPKTVVPSNPDELKGSFTLAEVASGYGLELSAILEKAGWPADADPNVKMRDVANTIGRDSSDIRNAVKELLENR